MPGHLLLVAPYAGAWIEIIQAIYNLGFIYVAPYAGAWIEIIIVTIMKSQETESPPTRGRGLKSSESCEAATEEGRPLRGGVD